MGFVFIGKQERCLNKDEVGRRETAYGTRDGKDGMVRCEGEKWIGRG